MIVTDDAGIRAVNRETRGIDTATDVLSFPVIHYPAGTARGNAHRLRQAVDPETGRAFIGDIVLSLERARAQADEYGHGVAREISFLTAHALLHLLGYDHVTDGDRRVMRDMEEAAMAALGLRRKAEPISDGALFMLACGAMNGAYAPYSKFRVGACILADDGRVFTGCNVENASYGAAICAERTAAVKAVTEGVKRFAAVAVAADSAAWPCGICRQFLFEFALPDMRAVVGKAGCDFQVVPLADLLPHAFGPDSMEH